MISIPPYEFLEKEIIAKLDSDDFSQTSEKIGVLEKRLERLSFNDKNPTAALGNIKSYRNLVIADDSGPSKILSEVRELLVVHREELLAEEIRLTADDLYESLLGGVIGNSGAWSIFQFFARKAITYKVKQTVVNVLAEYIGFSCEMSCKVIEIRSKTRYGELETAYNFLDPMMKSEVRKRQNAVKEFVQSLGFKENSQRTLLGVLDRLKTSYMSPDSRLVKDLKTIIFGSLINIDVDSDEVHRETDNFVSTIATSLLTHIELQETNFDKIDELDNLGQLHGSLLLHYMKERGLTEDKLNDVIDRCKESLSVFERLGAIDEDDKAECENLRRDFALLQKMKLLVQGNLVTWEGDPEEVDLVRYQIMKVATDDKSVIKGYQKKINQSSSLEVMKAFYKECVLLPQARMFLHLFAEERLKESFSLGLYHRLLWLLKMSDMSLAQQMVHLADDVKTAKSIMGSATELLTPLLPSGGNDLLALHDQALSKGLEMLNAHFYDQPIIGGTIEAFLKIEIDSTPASEFFNQYSKFILFNLLSGAEGESFEEKVENLISEAYKIILDSGTDFDLMTSLLINRFLPEEVIPAIVKKNNQTDVLKRQLQKPLKKILQTYLTGIENSQNVLFDKTFPKKSLFQISGFIADFLEDKEMDFDSVADDETFIALLADKIVALSGGSDKFKTQIQGEIRKYLPCLDNTTSGKKLVLEKFFGVDPASIPDDEDAIDKLIQNKVVEQVDKRIPLIIRLFLWPLIFIAHWRIRSVVRRVLKVKDRDNFPLFLRLLVLESLELVNEEESDESLKRVIGDVVGSKYNPVKKFEAAVGQFAVRFVKIPDDSIYDHAMKRRSKLTRFVQRKLTI